MTGHVVPHSESVDAPMGDEDALDELTVLVTTMGGSVYCCEQESLQTPSKVLAVLRGYPANGNIKR